MSPGRLNLATVPLERRRSVAAIVVAAAVVVASISLAHASLATWLVMQPSLQTAPAGSDEGSPDAAIAAVESTRSQLLDWSQEVDRIVVAARPEVAARIARLAEQARELISMRALPWSQLFADLETILPDDVRLEVVQPTVDDDGIRVTLTAASASREPLRRLLSGMEQLATFQQVFPRREERGPDGRFRATIDARYRPPAVDSSQDEATAQRLSEERS